MKIKSFDQFILVLENANKAFIPKYFSLPYFIPEDRFEGGLLKSNTNRKTSNSREIKDSSNSSKYSNISDFFAKESIQKIEKKILSEINRVVKFISNNKLTGQILEAEFEQSSSLSEYLKDLNSNEDVAFGTITTNLPFSTFFIRVDYDVYKNIPVFTFWHDGDLFYYYTVFTLETNDVSGSGEYHTYITADEFVDYLFYETVWRAAFNELQLLDVEPEQVGFSESEFYRLAEIDLNSPFPSVNNYFNKNFSKMLKNWIEFDEPSIKKEKSNTSTKFTWDTIPYSGLMSFPGNASRLCKFSQGPVEGGYTIRLLELEKDDVLLALKFNFDDTGLTSIESGEYQVQSLRNNWSKVKWKPLTQNEVNSLYFTDKKGKPIYLQSFIK